MTHPIFKTLTLPSFKDSSELLMKLTQGNVYVSSYAKDIILKLPPREKEEVFEYEIKTLRDIGFTREPTWRKILDKVKELGYDTSPDIAVAVSVVSSVDRFAWIPMEPITDSDGIPRVFCVRRGDSGPVLSASYVSPERRFGLGARARACASQGAELGTFAPF